MGGRLVLSARASRMNAASSARHLLTANGAVAVLSGAFGQVRPASVSNAAVLLSGASAKTLAAHLARFSPLSTCVSASRSCSTPAQTITWLKAPSTASFAALIGIFHRSYCARMTWRRIPAARSVAMKQLSSMMDMPSNVSSTAASSGSVGRSAAAARATLWRIAHCSAAITSENRAAKARDPNEGLL